MQPLGRTAFISFMAKVGLDILRIHDIVERGAESHSVSFFDTAHARIYDRLLEMCASIRFSGENFRKTTYRVWAHFSEISTETMEDKIKCMLREEIRQMMSDG